LQARKYVRLQSAMLEYGELPTRSIAEIKARSQRDSFAERVTLGIEPSHPA
jgi:hypothetical protein